jgi:hypothetical protein
MPRCAALLHHCLLQKPKPPAMAPDASQSLSRLPAAASCSGAAAADPRVQLLLGCRSGTVNPV